MENERITIGIRVWLHFPFSPKLFLINTNKRSRERGGLGTPLQTSFRHHLAPARDVAQGAITGALQASFRRHFRCTPDAVQAQFGRRFPIVPALFWRHLWRCLATFSGADEGCRFDAVWWSEKAPFGAIFRRSKTAFQASFSGIPDDVLGAIFKRSRCRWEVQSPCAVVSFPNIGEKTLLGAKGCWRRSLCFGWESEQFTRCFGVVPTVGTILRIASAPFWRRCRRRCTPPPGEAIVHRAPLLCHLEKPRRGRLACDSAVNIIWWSEHCC